MLSLSRQLVALDMLCLELADLAEQVSANAVPLAAPGAKDKYLSLLQQFCELAQHLSEASADYSNYEFVHAVAQSAVSIQFKNKAMLTVYLRLVQFVLEYYQITRRILAIRDSHFDAHADERLQLLQTRAIKARSQFKMVAQALGKKDYQQFAQSLTLPAVDWGWEVLRLESQ